MAKVREQLVKMIGDVCRPHPVDLSDHGRPLLDSGLDSLDYASVVMAIEDNFKIEVPQADVEKLGSIDAMVTYIEARKNA
jgi:acyl carrier protein